jgi:hypothetical protein
VDIFADISGYFPTGINVVQVSIKQYFEHHSRVAGGSSATFASINHPANIKFVNCLTDQSCGRTGRNFPVQPDWEQAVKPLIILFEYRPLHIIILLIIRCKYTKNPAASQIFLQVFLLFFDRIKYKKKRLPGF